MNKREISERVAFRAQLLSDIAARLADPTTPRHLVELYTRRAPEIRAALRADMSALNDKR